MKVGRDSITQRAARQAGVSRKKADRAFAAMVTVIGQKMQTEGVMIEGFGVFRPPEHPTDNYQWFRPAEELVNRCTARVESIPMPKKSIVRAEDAAYIDRWLEVRRGQKAEQVTATTLYGRDDRRRQTMKIVSDSTVRTARGTMRTFAARCPTPIAQLGLEAFAFATPDQEVLRRGILAYAQDFQDRMLPRMQKLLATTEGQERRQVPVAFRTVAWSNFVRYAWDFYEWLIQEGVRPAGSNPLDGIDKRFFSPIDFNKGRIKVVRRWYARVLAYPRLKPRPRAMLFLLANGLRISECANVRIEHLDLNAGSVLIVRKGGRLKKVLLKPWAVQSIVAYLETRWDKPSPWLFAAGRDYDRPITHHGVRMMVYKLAERVYPRDDQDHIRKAIHPHGFRHFYATNALAEGMAEAAVQQQLGHTSSAMTRLYITPDEEFVRKQHDAVANTKWF